MAVDPDIRFPGEREEYREARNRLLEAEVELRRAAENVAAARRKLPSGGPIPEDYLFEEAGEAGGAREVRLSELFSGGRESLILYSFMYGPEMQSACPSCTSILDSLDGAAAHVSQRVGLAAVAKSPLPRILDFASERGWRRLRLLSSAGNSYNRDYHGETPTGAQMPMLNVFVRDRGEVRHFWGSELLYTATEEGQEPRHVDTIWPLWNLLDLTPGGRGNEWSPQLRYDRA